MGGELRYVFNAENASSHFVSHIERIFSKFGRNAGIYHLPWIQTGLKLQSFLLVAGLPLFLMVKACRALPLFCMDLPIFPCS